MITSTIFLSVFTDTWVSNFNYVISEFLFGTEPWWHNYFWWLILLSAVFFIFEAVKPWRENQKVFRKDFWLDFFTMLFNFTLFGLVIYAAASTVVVDLFQKGLAAIGIDNLLAIEVQSWPIWGHLLLGFVVRDFTQWWIHRLLHRVNFLWEFHKVHHSVEQMGFAAHLRYHWMENIVYRTLEYLPLALIGIGLTDFFIIHIFTIAVGHYNHSNFVVKPWLRGTVFGSLAGLFIAFVVFNLEPLYGLGVVACGAVIGASALAPIMKYIFNGPKMHIWHHAHTIPEERRFGINFGLTLSCWDYIFGTAYIPEDGRDIKLGFPGIEEFPDNFAAQQVYGFIPQRDKRPRTENKNTVR